MAILRTSNVTLKNLTSSEYVPAENNNINESIYGTTINLQFLLASSHTLQHLKENHSHESFQDSLPSHLGQKRCTP
jgi:hypothetical protein